MHTMEYYSAFKKEGGIWHSSLGYSCLTSECLGSDPGSVTNSMFPLICTLGISK